MKKLKRLLSLFLMISLFFGMGIQSIQAIPMNKVSKLEIRVNGNGKVIVDDGYSKYSLEDEDVFSANCTLDTKLKITITPNDGYYISSVEGIESSFKESGKSRIYNVSHKVDGTYINISFSKEESNQGLKEEANNGALEKVENNEEEIKETSDLEEVLTEEQLKEIEIINQYIQGIKMLPEQIEARKNKAEELDLLEWVDENYFLIDDFYRGKSEADIEDIGANILVNTVTNEELDSWAKKLKYGSLLKTVTYYEMVSYGQSTVGKFEVDGRMAFCAQHSKTTPAKGSSTGTPSLNTNDLVRKVLYYGYGGPGQLSNMTGNYGWVITSLGLSKAYTGTGGSTATSFIEQVSQLPSPPSSFKVYVVQTNGGSTQDLAYWEYSPKGSLQIYKSSAKPEITNNNNYYSIAGAVYGVYTNSNATGEIATLTIGSDGWSQIIELDEGTYYIKEKTAPKGYALDSTIYSISVHSGSKAVGKYTDKPQTDPVSIILSKVDVDTGNASPQGNGTLADAQFTIKFYAGEYNDGINPGDLGITPTKTWILKTDSNGRCRLNDAYKVSGDSFWYNSQGIPTLPLGTLTIQETKAPIGYKINSEIFVRRITPNGTAEGVNTYNEPIVKEDVLEFTIKKVQSGTDIVIPNIKFKHTLPDGSIEELKTDSNGEIVIKGLTQGVHTIVESEAVEGYEINSNEFKFEVTSENTIRVISNTTNLGMTYSESNGDGFLTVSNELKPYSLNLLKVNDDSKVLEGAEFTLYSDKECNNVLDTQISDSKGKLAFKNLKVGIKYYLKETKAPQGYRIPVDADGKVHVYEIYVESIPAQGKFDYYIDGVKYTINDTNSNNSIYLSGTSADRELNLKVVNIATMKLPKTGSWLMIPLVLAGVGLMSYSLISSKKKKENK